MGVQERRAREREVLRRKIIDAAAQLIVANGYEAFSLRQVADKIEYSASSIYLYFKNKEELIKAICAETFDELIARMERLEARNLPPLESFEEGIREYIRFGLQYPKHYELVFSRPTPTMTAPPSPAVKASRRDIWFSRKLARDRLRLLHRDPHGSNLLDHSSFAGSQHVPFRDTPRNRRLLTARRANQTSIRHRPGGALDRPSSGGWATAQRVLAGAAYLARF